MSPANRDKTKAEKQPRQRNDIEPGSAGVIDGSQERRLYPGICQEAVEAARHNAPFVEVP